jgi:hypothetical protein
MPDPVSETAEYVVMARPGLTTVYLSQHGRFQDPGAVAVICERPIGVMEAVTRWLSGFRHAGNGAAPRMADGAHSRNGRCLGLETWRREE